MRNKKLLIGIGSGILIISVMLIAFWYLKNKEIKEAKAKIELVDNLEVEFLSEVYVSDLIKNKDINIVDDYEIDTKEIGKQRIVFKFLNDSKREITYSLEIEVKDIVPPLVWLNSSYTVYTNSEDNWKDKILCGDNYDSNPECMVEGFYDLSTSGEYDLVFKATDNSGNVTEKNFTLKVKDSSKGSSSSSGVKTSTEFSDVIANYKTDNTQIGVDVSKWQGEIDFNALKEAGVEFVIIRVGSTSGKDGEYFVDSRFEQNIQNANIVGIPVGVYFYSYASSRKRAISDAKWVVEQIKDYQVDLPVVFDWENWNSFNEFNLSFFGLTDMANGYLETVESHGYKGMLYSSKTYLENIWLSYDYPTWLAHYTKMTNYEGDYEYWQLCNNGHVDGINGDVDINIRYLN